MSSTDRVLRSHSASATRSRSVSDFQPSLHQDPALATWTPTILSSVLPLKGPVVIACDNKAAIPMCKGRKEGQRFKHIDIIHHFARDHVASRELQFVYCKSEGMPVIV
jgi:hypothetical protein